MSVDVGQQFRPVAARQDTFEFYGMAPSSVAEDLVCDEEDHRPNEDKQHDSQPIAYPCGPAVMRMPCVVMRHISSFLSGS